MDAKYLFSILASTAAVTAPASATVVFSDDFDDPDGTLINGKAPDVGDGTWIVTEDLFGDLDVVGGIADTSGTARKAFGFFTAPLGPGQTLTLTVDTAASPGGNFLAGGFAGVSLFSDGDELIFLGDTAVGEVWGVQNVFDVALTDNTDEDNTATFVYNYDTGDYSLTLETGEAIAGTFAANIAANNLRFANGDGNDIAIDSILVEITDSVPLVPGDADGDGDVDDTDLGIAISNFTGPGGTGKTLADGDADGDGDVDDTDLGIAISGFTGPLSPAAVPEPTSLALLGLGGLLAVRRRRA